MAELHGWTELVAPAAAADSVDEVDEQPLEVRDEAMEAAMPHRRYP